MRRIALISPEAWAVCVGVTGERTGGAETQFHLIAKGLLARGWPLSLIVSAPKNRDTCLPPWAYSAYKQRGYPTKLGFLADSYRLFLAMRQTKAEVFFQRCSFHDAPRVALFSKALKAKFIFWLGADYNADLKWQKDNLSCIRRVSFWKSLRSADVIVAQTKSQAQKIRECFGLESIVITNAVAVEKSYPLRSKRFEIRPTRTIVWGGRLNQNKRPELLLQLAQRTPNWTYIAAVLKERDGHDRLQSFMAAAHSIPNIKVEVDLSHQQYCDLIGTVDLALNTSIMEGFPNTLLEAFAKGVPALTFGIDPDGIIRSNSLGWVCDSIDSAHETIRSLEESPGLLLDAGRKAHQYVLDHHSEVMILDAVESLLNDLFHQEG